MTPAQRKPNAPLATFHAYHPDDVTIYAEARKMIDAACNFNNALRDMDLEGEDSDYHHGTVAHISMIWLEEMRELLAPYNSPTPR